MLMPPGVGAAGHTQLPGPVVRRKVLQPFTVRDVVGLRRWPAGTLAFVERVREKRGQASCDRQTLMWFARLESI